MSESDVVDEARRRAAKGRQPSRRARPRAGRLVAACALAALSGLMLLYRLTYSVPRCEAASAYLQTIPPTRVGEPGLDVAAAPQVAHAPDDCSRGSLLDFILPPPSRANASLVSDTLTQQQSDEARRTDARPSPTPALNDQDKADRPNIFRRFFRWLFGPFRTHKSKALPNMPPVVNSLTLSKTTVECVDSHSSPEDALVRVTVSASDADGDALSYEFSADAGRISHGAPNDTSAAWDLSDAAPGVHRLTVVAFEAKHGRTAASAPYMAALVVPQCAPPRPACPTFDVSGPDTVNSGEPVTFTANVSGGDPNVTPTFNWTVSAGTITSGQGTTSITVDTSNTGGQTVTATADCGGYDRFCATSDSCTTSLVYRALPRRFDEFKSLQFDDDKGSWDKFAIALQSDPAAQGYIICYGGRRGRAGEAKRLCDRSKGYLVNTRGVSNDRVVTIGGGYREEQTIEIWVVPVGAEPPGATPTVDPSEMQNTPTPTPTPDASPSPTPDETPTPTPTPSPTLTPTPTPTESPTPEGQKRKVADKISVNRPERFLESKEDTVTCELAMVSGKVISAEMFQNGDATLIDKPSTPTGGQVGPLSESFGEAYTSFAQFSLVSDDLDFQLDSERVQPVPAQVERKADWTWRVRLKNSSKKTVSFTVRLDVVWRPKTPGASDIVRSVWERKFENIPVGLPADVKVAPYGSLLGGIGALGLVVPGVRRRRLDELRVEVKGFQDEEADPAPVVIEVGNGGSYPVEVGGRPPPMEGVAASAESPPAEAETDELSCSVYTRHEARPGDSFLVQVFAHLAEQFDQLAARALKSDKLAEELGSETFDAPVARGDSLTIKLDMPGLEVDEPAQSFVWKGEIKRVQFGVAVPKGLAPKSLFGKVTVCRNTVPVGHVRFAFEVVAAGEPAGEVTPSVEPARGEEHPAGEFKRYRQAFISYSSKDRGEVLRRVQMLRLVRLKFRQDLLDLEPGQKWESTLYRYIDESDVVFLFWSKAARESEWVEKELKHALARKGGREEAPPEIVPVIIEGPPPAPPPPYLAADHFNDTLQYFVWVEDQLKKAGCGPQPATPPEDAGGI